MDNMSILEEEKQYYADLFKRCDTLNRGILSGSDVTKLFVSSDLPQDILQQITELCGAKRVGHFGIPQFYVALKLIALAQRGHPLSLDSAVKYKEYLIPVFKDIQSIKAFTKHHSNHGFNDVDCVEDVQSPSPPESPQSPLETTTNHRSEATKSWAQFDGDKTRMHDHWVITEQQQQFYTRQFVLMQPDLSGKIDGGIARQFFQRSKLDINELSHIWQLADRDQDGRLSWTEFSVAMHLVVARRNGLSLPAVLPRQLLPLSAQESALNQQQPDEPLIEARLQPPRDRLLQPVAAQSVPPQLLTQQSAPLVDAGQTSSQQQTFLQPVLRDNPSTEPFQKHVIQRPFPRHSPSDCYQTHEEQILPENVPVNSAQLAWTGNSWARFSPLERPRTPDVHDSDTHIIQPTPVKILPDGQTVSMAPDDTPSKLLLPPPIKSRQLKKGLTIGGADSSSYRQRSTSIPHVPGDVSHVAWSVEGEPLTTRKSHSRSSSLDLNKILTTTVLPDRQPENAVYQECPSVPLLSVVPLVHSNPQVVPELVVEVEASSDTACVLVAKPELVNSSEQYSESGYISGLVEQVPSEVQCEVGQTSGDEQSSGHPHNQNFADFENFEQKSGDEDERFAAMVPIEERSSPDNHSAIEPSLRTNSLKTSIRMLETELETVTRERILLEDQIAKIKLEL